jgi:hypothetical protein
MLTVSHRFFMGHFIIPCFSSLHCVFCQIIKNVVVTLLIWLARAALPDVREPYQVSHF